MTKCLETLETNLEASSKYNQLNNSQELRPVRQQFRSADQVCWLCGEVGNIRRQCPLNENGPAQTVGSWPCR